MKKLVTWLLLITIVMFAAGCSGSSSKEEDSNRDSVVIERVIDGDTVEIKWQGKKKSVRLIGIDTPETKKANTPVMFYGPEASEFTKQQLEKKKVELEWDVEQYDKYDRLLAYVWLDGELFNSTLVKEGYARISTFPPNVKYADRFKKDQEEARKQEKGIWKDYAAAFGKSK
ncbi:thermonuclease family protein [Paenibacillus sp. y28]|uniref:thermonuclease family protein n=1 Tax=Paenibacillus sp. y28 TaxID=3129110 RepID=UPI003018EF07